MKTILATDGSPYAGLAEELAVRIPEVRAGEIVVATAIAPPTVPMLGIEPLGAPLISEDLQRMFDAQLAAAQKCCADLESRLAAQGLACRSVVVEGEPGPALLQLAERENPDLIALGSRGIGGLEGLLLGSVAKELVAKAPCDVLVARKFESLGIEESLARIAAADRLSATLGFDGTDGSQVALNKVKRQGRDAFRALYVVCAEPLGVFPVGVNPADFGSVYTEDHDRVVSVVRRGEAELEGMAATVSGGEGLGGSAQVLSEFARAKDTDVIVVGATRHGAFERFLIGSVASELASSAPCPVWVVRAPRE